jgi:nucleoside-diphosphate-sugar epimerase
VSPIVVTGASGFLGRHVCGRLVAKGRRARALVRNTGAAVAAGAEPVVVPDVLDREAVRRAMAGACAVVHLAARVHVMEDRAADPLAAFRQVNVDGTAVVLEEALRAGASSFVFASSVKAVGEATDTPWTDDVVPAPVDPYGISKLEAEQLIADRAALGPIRTCIFRLPLVYGAGMKGNMPRVFDLVDRGLPLPFGLIANRRALAYAGNVAAAVEAALDYDETLAPTPFFVSDGTDVSTAELVREIARAIGRPARLLPVPPAFIRGAGRAGDLLSRVMRPPFRSAHADRLLGSLTLDTSRFRHVTGFSPPFTLRQGLAETARWYRDERAAGRHSPGSPIVMPKPASPRARELRDTNRPLQP